MLFLPVLSKLSRANSYLDIKKRHKYITISFFFFPPECCLFVFFDGSAYYFDDYLRLLTGPYRLMYGTVNGHPHYVARGCKEPGEEYLCFKTKSLHDTAIFRKKIQPHRYPWHPFLIL